MRFAGEATVLVPVILFLGTLIRSSLGFGEALVSVPLLALVMPVEVAAPLAVLVSITVAGIVVIQDRSHIHLRSAGWLVLATLPGIPLGLLLLKAVAEPIVKGILAAVIIAFSIYSLAHREMRELKHDRPAWLFGFIAGILGGAYGMNGPPLVIYGSLRRWTPKHFRATLQGYFFPASLIGMGGYGLAGLWTRTVNHFFLWSLPAVLIAIFLGRAINQHLNPRQFGFYVHVGLLLIGVLLMVQSVRGV